MTFQELASEVLLIVKRPDMQTRIESAIRAATLKAHNSDFYYRDIVETGVQFDTPGRVINFDPKQIFPRFRKPAYIRKWNFDPADTQYQGAGAKFLDFISPDDIMDAYGYYKPNICYMAGNLLQIRSTEELSHILFGAYVYPTVTPEASYSSWIADEYPFAIIYEAARQVFMGTGLQEQASNMTTSVSEEYRQLKVNSVATEGY